MYIVKDFNSMLMGVQEIGKDTITGGALRELEKSQYKLLLTYDEARAFNLAIRDLSGAFFYSF